MPRPSQAARALVAKVVAARAVAPRKGKLKAKVRPARYPRNLEQAYTRQLMALVKHAEQVAKTHLQPVLQAKDTGEVRRVIANARTHLAMTLPDSRVAAIAGAMGRQVRQYADSELQAQLKEAFGVNIIQLLEHANRKVRRDDDAELTAFDPFVDDPESAVLLKAFIDYNVSLIQSIPRNALTQLEALLLRDITQGKRASDLAAEIVDRFGVSESRAALIATSQIAAFFGDVTRVRQTALGINRAVWSTSNDERVRPTHAAVDDLVFSWDDPPAGTVEATMIPGSEPRCRCVATPYVQDLIPDIENAD